MSKETNPVTSERSAATFKASPESAQTSPAAQPRGSAEADQGRIAARAYELYEERGRQEGRAVEDWLNAERQLVGAAGKPQNGA